MTSRDDLVEPSPAIRATLPGRAALCDARSPGARHHAHVATRWGPAFRTFVDAGFRKMPAGCDSTAGALAALRDGEVVTRRQQSPCATPGRADHLVSGLTALGTLFAEICRERHDA